MRDDFEQTQKKPPKMLIADDDPSVLSLLAERCAKMGFDVTTAANGMQLLIKARQGQPDMLIVDVNMPELDGLAACSRLLSPDSKPVEVLVVTGRSDAETIERCESFGAYYGHKGPDLWKEIEATLTELYPHMSGKITEQTIQTKNQIVHERPRVLIVDDDQSMETFLASRLAKYGVDTLYASDATHGYRMACKERPSVIVADLYMPNGDAHYLLARLRATAATENIPVFVISAKPLDEVTKQSLRRDIKGHPGAVQFFGKSFDTDELFTALQKYMSFENTSKFKPTMSAMA